MRPVARASLCAVLLASFVLAGCASSSKDTSSSASGTTSHGATTSRSSGPGGVGGGTTGPSGGPSGGPTSGGNPANNHAPAGTISANIQKGTLPLNVTFSLTGNDQDGDKLTWNLDADGDGKTDKSGDSLPATTSYNYTKAGNFTAKYVISDGKTTTTYPLPINVTAAAGGDGPSWSATGGYTVGGPENGCLGAYQGSNANLGPTSGQDYAPMTVPPAAIGKDFTATYQYSGTVVALFVSFYDSGGSSVGRASAGQASTGATVLTGTVPANAASANFTSCGGANVTLTVTA